MNSPRQRSQYLSCVQQLFQIINGFKCGKWYNSVAIMILVSSGYIIKIICKQKVVDWSTMHNNAVVMFYETTK